MLHIQTKQIKIDVMNIIGIMIFFHQWTNGTKGGFGYLFTETFDDRSIWNAMKVITQN